MIRIIIALGLLFTTLNTTAQDPKVSFTLAYPLPIGDNFVSAYTGIADLGVQIRFLDAGPVKIGVSTNANFLGNSNDLGSVTIKENSLLIQPRVFGELNLNTIDKFKPFFGLGYTFTSFITKYRGASQPDDKNSYGGFNINIGAAYNISDVWFVHLQYDNVKLSRKGLGQEPSFFNNISQLKFGLGLRF